MASLDAALKKKVGSKKESDIEDLNLDNVNVGNDLSFLKKFTNLQFLSLNSCRVTSLESLPKLPSLVTLELADNKISGGLDALSGFDNLERLDLANTKIEKADDLNVLSSLPTLMSLDLMGTPFAENDKTYRQKVFDMCKSLTVVDALDRCVLFVATALSFVFVYIFACAF